MLWVLSIMPKILETSVEIKMEGSFRFLLTGISAITSGGGPRVLSIMPEVQEISVGIQMERFVSVSSDRNIRDRLRRWFTYSDRNSPFHF